LSTVLLIVLAVFGSGLDGVSVAGFDVFPFILYLIPHSILVFFLVNRHSEYLFDIPSPLVAVLLFALYAVGSSFLAIGASSVLKVMVIVVASISVAAFAYWSVGDAWSLRRYVGILQLLALLGLAIAVIEITTSTHLPVSKRFGMDAYYKSTAWYVNENDFSMFLAMVSFLFLADTLIASSISRRVFSIAAFFASVIVIYVNNSRAALLAVAIIGGIVLILFWGRTKLSDRFPPNDRGRLITTTVFGVAFGVIILVLLIGNPFERQSSRSLWFRWQTFEASVAILIETGGLGAGIGNFPTALEQSEVAPDFAAKAHNWFAALLGECGVLGTLLFLLAYGRTADGLLYRFITHGDAISLGLLGGLLSFGIAGLGPSGPMSFQIQWIIIGLGIAAAYRLPNAKSNSMTVKDTSP